MKKKIVCACVKYERAGITIPCIRHYDKFSRSLEKLLIDKLKDEIGICGFLDNKGNFLTRQEAYKFAIENNQELIEPTYMINGENSLLSENLY